MTLIPPYDHADVIAGQGTAAKELFEEVGALDVLFVPSAAAACSAGCALAARALSPRCKLVRRRARGRQRRPAVVPAGEIVHIAPQDHRRRRADAALGQLTFAIIRRDVDDIVTASDAQLVEAMRFFAERMKMVVEPTGCLGFAGRATRLRLRASASA